MATIALPLGDLTSRQMRKLVSICKRYVKDTVRTTVEQNIVLRWVSDADLPALFADLKSAGLADSGAGTMVDITSCPGTDTCKLGIASSRGLAAELRKRIATKGVELDEAIEGLRIKISGCFNSCGQHHAADIGFYGNSRKINGITVPHFQVVLGGQWRENAGSFGLAMGAVPVQKYTRRRERLSQRFIEERQKDESFQDYIQRMGKRDIKAMLDDLTVVPAFEENSWYYQDWGDTRTFTMDDLGVGECAGEVVSATVMEIAAAEREVFEAQVHLEDSDIDSAVGVAYRAIVRSARARARASSFTTWQITRTSWLENSARDFSKRSCFHHSSPTTFLRHTKKALRLRCFLGTSAHRRGTAFCGRCLHLLR